MANDTLKNKVRFSSTLPPEVDKILKDYIYEAQKPKEARREDIKDLEKCLNLQFSNYYYSILEYSYIRRREDKESQGIIKSIFNSIVDKTRKRTKK